LWVLVLTSLLVLLRPCDTQALSLGYTDGKLDTYSSAVQLLTVNSRQILPGKQSDLVFPDYLQRSHIISVYEEKVAQSPDSSIFLRLLADQYLRRFREIGDIDDVL
ncbi:MAG: tetratricopeptide repeat protein, partial [Nostoc sp.]